MEQNPKMPGDEDRRIRPILGEFLIILLGLLLSFLIVNLLAFVLTVAGVSDPCRAARKPLVPLFAAIWLLLLRARKGELPRWFGWVRPPAEASPGAIGWKPSGHSDTVARLIFLGFLGGAIPLIAMLIGLTIAGARIIDLRLSFAEMPVAFGLYLLQALILGLLEESLFRGILHHRFRLGRRGVSATLAALFAAAVFSAAHFLRPPRDRPPEAWWDTATACLAGLEHLWTRFPSAFGLFLVGLVLVVLRRRFGSIWLPLGVHAGWVWITKISRKTLDDVKEVTEANPLFWGSEQVYDGIVGWSALIVTLLICLWIKPSRTVCDTGAPQTSRKPTTDEP